MSMHHCTGLREVRAIIMRSTCKVETRWELHPSLASAWGEVVAAAVWRALHAYALSWWCQVVGGVVHSEF